MDLATFILAERVTGTVSPVDSNPLEPPRPGVLHYLATMYREGRTFATHLSAPVGHAPDLAYALQSAAERARRLEASATHDEWLRASGMHDESADPLEVGAAHAGEVELLWHRAQQAEVQALRRFLGEVAYRRLVEVVGPARPADGTAAPGGPGPWRGARAWLIGATAGAAVLGLPLLLARAGRRRSRLRSALRRIVPA